MLAMTEQEKVERANAMADAIMAIITASRTMTASAMVCRSAGDTSASEYLANVSLRVIEIGQELTSYAGGLK